jgi:UDP-N-acetylmuramate dehydrogenase
VLFSIKQKIKEMRILENISLEKFNTFQIDVKAKFFAEVTCEKDIHTLIDNGMLKDNKYFILGSGSNTLFVEDFDGVIIKNKLKGMNYAKVTDGYNVVNVSTGENWHEFVSIMNRNRLYGLENLAFIPGEVGAAPIQNIGAYGVEQKDFFDSLDAIDLNKNEKVTFSNEDCQFSYRNSGFKHNLKDKYIITSVRYQLTKEPVLNYQYSALSNEIKKFAIEKPDTQYIFDTIIRLRKNRLPDHKILGNAGSFFKNPIISNEKTEKLLEIYPELPVFRESKTHKKIPAAFLIQKAGWKGKRIGNVGVYDDHALIIVNHGGAKGKEIFDFAKRIIDDIADKFDIILEPEVVII